MTGRIRAMALALIGISVGVPASAQMPLKVYVTAAQPEARKKVDDATRKDLQGKMDAARHARQELEKQLRNQYGKKEESWPEDRQDAVYDAREAEALAVADYEYRRIDPQGLADSAQDLKNALIGKGLATEKPNVELVDSAEAADLVAEVVARRSANDPSQPSLGGFRDNSYFISFLLRSGGRMDAARLSDVKQYRFKKFGQAAWTLQRPRPDMPMWRFDAFGTQRWSNAASTASLLINDFIGKNHAVLTTKPAA